MKIAFFVSEFPSVSETFILNQVTGLIDRGYGVDIYAVSAGKQQLAHRDVEKYNLLNRTFYITNAAQNVSRNKLWRLLKAIWMTITRFHYGPVPLLKALNVFRFGKEAASLSLLYRVMWYLDKRLPEYNVVHCHFGERGSACALLKELGLIKGKLLTTFYGFDISQEVRERGSDIYAALFEQADAVLAVSERMKQQLVQLGCSREKVLVHRLGVDTNKFRPAGRRGERSCIRMLTIARLVEKKGVEYGIRGVAQLLKKYPNIEYEIIGDGPLKVQLEHLVSTLGVEQKVKLYGWRKQDAVIDALSDADILLAPSVTAQNGDEEGTPTVIIEALACGLPVVSTTHSAIPEVVQDGSTGFLVQEKDVDGLADRLVYAIENRNIWADMGRRGRESVQATYDINKLNDRLLVLYEELTGGTSRDPRVITTVSCARQV